jgi:hypothetical protein
MSIPLWKENGFKSKEEGFKWVIEALLKEKSLKGGVVQFNEAMIQCGTAAKE